MNTADYLKEAPYSFFMQINGKYHSEVLTNVKSCHQGHIYIFMS